ncbi:MAG: hypothetical protein CMB99_06950 [Flavobacteriaceae bacterium]|nr:hypothetical protein [Flavobacteriaceae bacterium]|tara:strand:+ start:40405 stop:41046 length:642 start_codon:yes stop_codon:yes gene_type:complete
MKQFTYIFLIFFFASLEAQEVAILKYNGGGDWYANPTAVPNLVRFTNENTQSNISENIKTVTAGNEDIFSYPIIFMTGHGNVVFSNSEIENLRNYLTSGGFLHISDNYGLDKFIRRELKRLFPKNTLEEIPSNHPIFDQQFKFSDGIPKIHEHDKKSPKGYGIFYEGRLVVFYDHETDLSDGWEDESIHNNPPKVREKALQMGSNIIQYAFSN